MSAGVLCRLSASLTPSCEFFRGTFRPVVSSMQVSSGSVKPEAVEVFFKMSGALDIAAVRKKPKEWIPGGAGGLARGRASGPGQQPKRMWQHALPWQLLQEEWVPAVYLRVFASLRSVHNRPACAPLQTPFGSTWWHCPPWTPSVTCPTAWPAPMPPGAAGTTPKRPRCCPCPTLKLAQQV